MNRLNFDFLIVIITKLMYWKKNSLFSMFYAYKTSIYLVIEKKKTVVLAFLLVKWMYSLIKNIVIYSYNNLPWKVVTTNNIFKIICSVRRLIVLPKNLIYTQIVCYINFIYRAWRKLPPICLMVTDLFVSSFESWHRHGCL